MKKIALAVIEPQRAAAKRIADKNNGGKHGTLCCHV
jgi:hypothetical protein